MGKSIFKYLNDERLKDYKEYVEKLKELGAPSKIIKEYERKIERYEKEGKSLYSFSKRIPQEKLDEEFVSIEEKVGPRGGKYTCINGKYKLNYIYRFRIWALDDIK